MTSQQTVDFDGPIGPSMSEFSAEYMTYVESHLDEDLTHVADRILTLLRSMESLTQGFVVDQLQHSLQTATRAERGGAIPRHDRRLVVPRHRQDHQQRQPPGHRRRDDPPVGLARGVLGGQGAPGLPGPALLRAHGPRPDDAAASTRATRPTTWPRQFADDWDQTAFDPDYDTLPLEHFEPMVREVFGRSPRRGDN